MSLEPVESEAVVAVERRQVKRMNRRQHPSLFQLFREQPKLIATLVIVASQSATPAKTPREPLSAMTSMPHDRDVQPKKNDDKRD